MGLPPPRHRPRQAGGTRPAPSGVCGSRRPRPAPRRPRRGMNSGEAGPLLLPADPLHPQPRGADPPPSRSPAPARGHRHQLPPAAGKESEPGAADPPLSALSPRWRGGSSERRQPAGRLRASLPSRFPSAPLGPPPCPLRAFTGSSASRRPGRSDRRADTPDSATEPPPSSPPPGPSPQAAAAAPGRPALLSREPAAPPLPRAAAPPRRPGPARRRRPLTRYFAAPRAPRPAGSAA